MEDFSDFRESDFQDSSHSNTLVILRKSFKDNVEMSNTVKKRQWVQ